MGVPSFSGRGGGGQDRARGRHFTAVNTLSAFGRFNQWGGGGGVLSAFGQFNSGGCGVLSTFGRFNQLGGGVYLCVDLIKIHSNFNCNIY